MAEAVRRGPPPSRISVLDIFGGAPWWRRVLILRSLSARDIGRGDVAEKTKSERQIKQRCEESSVAK